MPLRILLVDDTHADLVLAQHALAEVPGLVADVTAEESVAQAVCTIKANAYDLVITDLVFPSRLSGVDVAACAKRCGIPVVIISGSYPRLPNGVQQYEKPTHFDAWCTLFTDIVSSVQPSIVSSVQPSTSMRLTG